MTKKRTHELKLLDQYFDAVKSGEKTFEIRRDDRGFQRGDILVLNRYDSGYYVTDNGERRTYSDHAEKLNRRILWILTGGQFGLESGYVAMAIEPI